MDNTELAKNIGFLVMNLWGLKAENDALKMKIDGLMAAKPEGSNDSK